ncbi:response regulator [Arthrobacter halodurans]|uniref:Transcriptional regulatory protein n=1 Tax=Arthrobacter halodurans TaxID=516699 RepID=A0ABV4UP43_9MICC
MIRTLIIDDDPAVAGLHEGFLMAHGGFEVVGTAHTGEDGLRLLRGLTPDLVLLDIHLPGISGLEVLRRLRGDDVPAIDVFAITASRELETVRAALAGGVVQYLVKPFSAREFRERLDEYAAHRGELATHLETPGNLDQAAIDRLRSRRRGAVAPRTPGSGVGADRHGPARGPASDAPPAPAPPLPKGLSPATLQAVVAELSTLGADTSAAELASRLGMARVSARRYLEHLVSTGNARLTPRYGSAGRPENRYVWTGGG